jgi:glycogenin glucosyltransferase
LSSLPIPSLSTKPHITPIYRMEAFITLLTNNSYASGALVLGHSLRAGQTTKQLAILITAQVSRPIREKLAGVYDAVIEIGEIDSHSKANLELLGRPELGITLTKIHVFNQTQYSKVIFLDADTLVLRNIDELFDTAANGALDDKDRNKRFAAAPDAGWPDCFNSGVFVCRPSFEDYQGLIEMASQEGTFDGKTKPLSTGRGREGGCSLPMKIVIVFRLANKQVPFFSLS